MRDTTLFLANGSAFGVDSRRVLMPCHSQGDGAVAVLALVYSAVGSGGGDRHYSALLRAPPPLSFDPPPVSLWPAPPALELNSILRGLLTAHFDGLPHTTSARGVFRGGADDVGEGGAVHEPAIIGGGSETKLFGAAPLGQAYGALKFQRSIGSWRRSSGGGSWRLVDDQGNLLWRRKGAVFTVTADELCQLANQYQPGVVVGEPSTSSLSFLWKKFSMDKFTSVPKPTDVPRLHMWLALRCASGRHSRGGAPSTDAALELLTADALAHLKESTFGTSDGEHAHNVACALQSAVLHSTPRAPAEVSSAAPDRSNDVIAAACTMQEMRNNSPPLPPLPPPPPATSGVAAASQQPSPREGAVQLMQAVTAPIATPSASGGAAAPLPPPPTLPGTKLASEPGVEAERAEESGAATGSASGGADAAPALDAEAARREIAEILEAYSNDLSQLSVKEIRRMLEERWSLLQDALKPHRREIDAMVMETLKAHTWFKALKAKAEAEAEAEAEPEPEPEVEAEAGTEVEAEAGTEVEVDAGTEVEVDAMAVAEVDAVAEAEVDAEAEAEERKEAEAISPPSTSDSIGTAVAPVAAVDAASSESVSSGGAKRKGKLPMVVEVSKVSTRQHPAGPSVPVVVHTLATFLEQPPRLELKRSTLGGRGVFASVSHAPQPCTPRTTHLAPRTSTQEHSVQDGEHRAIV